MECLRENRRSQGAARVRESHPDAEQPLRAWYATASRARWKRPSDVKDEYRNASFIANNRAVFNVKGNAYRYDSIAAKRCQC
ncbi:MAG: type II toxin-antitoxin system HigB family toxin [Gammaproteobacteria bacterium]